MRLNDNDDVQDKNNNNVDKLYWYCADTIILCVYE